MTSRSSKARIASRCVVFLFVGLSISVLAAWTGAALRPTDGLPNAAGLNADQWSDHYFLPQFRTKTPWGDEFIDAIGNPISSRVSVAASWARRPLGPDDVWILKTYPYPQDVPQQVLDLHRRETGMRSFDLPAWAVRCDASTTEHNIITSAWGWPARCISGVEHVYANYRPDGTFAGTRFTLEGYWVPHNAAPTSRIRRLPIRPIWPGVVINTLLFTLAAGALFAVPRGLRRILHIRRGRCPHCAYNRAGLAPDAPCPECGQRHT